MCEHARGTLSALPTSQDSGMGEIPHLHHPTRVSLRRLFAELQRVVHADSARTAEYIFEVQKLLERVKLGDEEWRQFVNWNDTKYTRSLIAHDPNFTVLLLCWNRGQVSPIHDHAGSSCWVKVLHGVLRENRYQQNIETGAVERFQVNNLAADQVTYIDDSRGLHDMGGSDKDARCVSLHVYSPPYYYCNAFSLDGAKRQVSLLAATAPRRDTYQSNLSVRMLRHPHHHTLSNGEETAATTTTAGSPTSRGPEESTVTVRQLIDVLDSDAPTSDVVKAFERTYVPQEDWSYLAHFNESRYQRLLLHENARFSLLMLCWLPNQRTPVHDHNGSESWVKVLVGQLAIGTFKMQNNDPVSTGAMQFLTPESTAVPFHEDAALPLHAVGNEGTGFAISLHLYNPPYTEMCYQSLAIEPQVDEVTGQVSESAESSEAESIRSTSSTSSVSSRKKTIPCVSCHRPCKVSKLDSLTPILDRIFCGVCDLDKVEEVIEALSNFPVDSKEIHRFWDQRNRLGLSVRLAETPAYNIILNLWEPDACTVVHDHDASTAFVLVARGVLNDTTYLPPAQAGDKPRVYRTSKIKHGEVCYYTADALHSLRNAHKSEWAATIHVYHKKCAAATWYSLRVDAAPVRVAIGVGGTTILQPETEPSEAATPETSPRKQKESGFPPVIEAS